MKSYSSREVIKMLKADGWYGSKCGRKPPPIQASCQKGAPTVKHPDKDIPVKTLRCIEEQSGL